MLYSDLQELKSALDIDPENTSEDVKLNFILTTVSSWMEELLNRDLSLKTRTQYYQGTHTNLLPLKNRPILTDVTPRAWVDDHGQFGQAEGSFSSETELTYGSDFGLNLDLDTDNDGIDDASRSGILVRFDNFWHRQSTRQKGLLSPFLTSPKGTIKVTYKAGYTVATLPPAFKGAVDLLAARLRYFLPTGLEMQSESYEELSIGVALQQKEPLLGMVKPMILPYRNWTF